MKRAVFYLQVLLLFTLPVYAVPDVSLIGNVKYADGIGRLIIGLTDCLRGELIFNYFAAGKYDFTDVLPEVEKALKNPDKWPGKVSLLMAPLVRRDYNAVDYVPNESHVKLAYSMIEGTKVPDRWVELLNERFDGVVVPDIFYKKVYEESGVMIPVFVVPHGIYIEEFLEEPLHKLDKSTPFTFGLTANFWEGKNQKLVIEAFHKAFGNDNRVQLVLHGRGGHKNYENMLRKKIKRLKAGNITFRKSSLSDLEHKNLLRSFDCYVLLSKGEGFSVTPREALALGIPTIISNNTAHKTICNTGYVYAVPSEISQNAYLAGDKGYPVGEIFNCTVSDAAKAFQEVYHNYDVYQEKALQGREWVKQYLWKNIQPLFLSLLKPKKIILGAENTVTEDYLMTSSKALFDKYQKFISREKEK